MKIVIDTNIIISALIRDSVSRKIIANKEFNFITPSFSLSEIYKYKDEICQKSGIDSNEFYELLETIFRNIKIIKSSYYDNFTEVAKGLIKDINDIAFMVLALAFNCPIWSDDKHFQKQNKVKILTTKEMLAYLE